MELSINNVYEILGVVGTWVLITFGFLCGLLILIINIIVLIRGYK